MHHGHGGGFDSLLLKELPLNVCFPQCRIQSQVVSGGLDLGSHSYLLITARTWTKRYEGGAFELHMSKDKYGFILHTLHGPVASSQTDNGAL